MRIVAGFLTAFAATTISGVSFAESICDRPNGTVILVRQENMCDRDGACTNVSFSLERHGNKMRGRARYNGGGNAPGRTGLVTGEIGANGGMYWQVVWENGEIGTYKGTLVNGVGEGFTHGDNMRYYKYIAATATDCTKWSYLDPAAPPLLRRNSSRASAKPRPFPATGGLSRTAALGVLTCPFRRRARGLAATMWLSRPAARAALPALSMAGFWTLSGMIRMATPAPDHCV